MPRPFACSSHMIVSFRRTITTIEVLYESVCALASLVAVVATDIRWIKSCTFGPRPQISCAHRWPIIKDHWYQSTHLVQCFDYFSEHCQTIGFIHALRLLHNMAIRRERTQRLPVSVKITVSRFPSHHVICRQGIICIRLWTRCCRSTFINVIIYPSLPRRLLWLRDHTYSHVILYKEFLSNHLWSTGNKCVHT